MRKGLSKGIVLTLCIEGEKPEEVCDFKLDLSPDQQRKSQSLSSAELQAEYHLALVFLWI